MLLYLVAHVALASHPAILAQPGNDVRQLFAVGDYPQDALRHHWEGSAVADLKVGTNGRVSSCRILKSTGHQALDQATCNVLVRRARFKPASDKFGRPTQATFRTPAISWELR